jgi:hypothetical protein
MAQYKQTCSFYIYQGASNGDGEIIALLNEYAALRDDSVNSAGRRLLREVLPARIAELKRDVKKIA